MGKFDKQQAEKLASGVHDAFTDKGSTQEREAKFQAAQKLLADANTNTARDQKAQKVALDAINAKLNKTGLHAVGYGTSKGKSYLLLRTLDHGNRATKTEVRYYSMPPITGSDGRYKTLPIQKTGPGQFKVLPSDEQPGAAPPAGQSPGDTKPGDAKPGDAKPGDAKPGDAKPGDAKPGDAKPGDAKPGDAKPGDAKPGDAKPGDAKPGDAKPGDAKPGTAPAAVSDQSIPSPGNSRFTRFAAFLESPSTQQVLTKAGVFAGSFTAGVGAFEVYQGAQLYAQGDQTGGKLLGASGLSNIGAGGFGTWSLLSKTAPAWTGAAAMRLGGGGALFAGALQLREGYNTGNQALMFDGATYSTAGTLMLAGGTSPVGIGAAVYSFSYGLTRAAMSASGGDRLVTSGMDWAMNGDANNTAKAITERNLDGLEKKDQVIGQSAEQIAAARLTSKHVNGVILGLREQMEHQTGDELAKTKAEVVRLIKVRGDLAAAEQAGRTAPAAPANSGDAGSPHAATANPNAPANPGDAGNAPAATANPVAPANPGDAANPNNAGGER